MIRNILYTYRNLEEFNRLYETLLARDKIIHPFIFKTTMDLLENESDITIDISILTEYIVSNKQDRYSALFNLQNLNANNHIIIQIDLAEEALKQFPSIFSNAKPLFDEVIVMKDDLVSVFPRKTIFTYKNIAQLEKFIELTKQQNLVFFSFNQVFNKMKLIPNIDNKNQSIFVDLTTMIRASLSNNAHILYFSEQLFDSLPNVTFIVNQSNAKDILENIPLYFEKQADIAELFKELETNDTAIPEVEKLRRITDCNATELIQFEKEINFNLIGHQDFKSKFFKTIRNFIKLNKIKEKKILSLLLLGQSGLGKTEVARIIKKFLNENTSFAKINFGNYSSHDALNSLIGSPAGYIGCEGGELGIKAQKSKAGVIVCDEFEKTTRSVFNFFNELLEDGSFTDSLTREYDLDGYIIIFTSNLLTEEEFFQTIPPELQSRMDLVCKFVPLSLQEKKTYVEYQLDRYIERLSEEFAKHNVTDEIKKKLTEVNFSGTDNLRDIKGLSNNLFNTNSPLN